MPGKITVRCPGCKARVRAPVELSGQRRNCPGCGTPFVVRATLPSDSDPVIVSTDARPEPRKGW